MSQGASERETDAAGCPVAGIVFARGEPVDALLARLVAVARSAGARVAGVVQAPGGEALAGRGNLLLRGLRGGWTLPILEARGREARGCRLDYAAVAEVAARLDRDLAEGADLLVINRFGRAEAEGGGLRALLEAAVVAGTPVLVAVREDYAGAWAAFHGGLGCRLPPEFAACRAWLDARLAELAPGGGARPAGAPA